MATKKEPLRIAFFGTPTFATAVLDELHAVGIPPLLVVTQEDKPRGRDLAVSPTEVKSWAQAHEVDVIEPHNLVNSNALGILLNTEWDLFIVAAYGKIIPKRILDLPKFGTLNVHPSLLPKLRGASPVRTAILADQKDAVGISIIKLDEEMDHGPIIAQARIEPEDWPVGAVMLEELLAHEGGKLLAEAIPLWVAGELPEEVQNHTKATFSQKITKPMGEVDLHGNPQENLRKIKALEGWPCAYFFIEKDGKPYRVKIIDAEISVKDGALKILRVIPEGKKEMSYEDFARSQKRETPN